MIRAIRDNLVVRPFAAEEISSGGLVVPESFRERNNRGTVISVGGGTKKHPKTFNEGDVVFHVKDAGTEVVENGISYFIMKTWDVLGSSKN